MPEHPTSDRQRLSVAVVGGGYAGIAVAKALDEAAEVILVDPKDSFEHNVAALRALVEPAWSSRIHFPYDGLLKRGRVIRDRAVQVDSRRVLLESGKELVPDFIVLATGSSYPFPGNSGTEDAHEAAARFREGHDALSVADRVLLLGAGPVGIELAGEIAAVWPTKHVTIVDVVADLLGGRFKVELRQELRRQLEQRGVELVLGSPLREPPPTPPGVPGAFTVATEAGTEIMADLWFRCYGVTPRSDFLAGDLAAARTSEGFIEVTPTLQLPGHARVFALGDVSTLSPKMAGYAGVQAQLVASNIRALIDGGDLEQCESSPDVILVTFGPEGGAAQLRDQDEIAGAETAAQYKSRDMMVDRFRAMFDIVPSSD
ncbi:MAG: FAD-dependent oxidoreductase [Solirubrobacteraceae bacterium]|jgi:apoptosis-inducing factor 2